MNRRAAREHAFIAMFELGYGATVEELTAACGEEGALNQLDAFGEALLAQYEAHAADVDEAIRARLKGWTADRLPRTSLAVLRLAVTEMLYGTPDLDSVAINEAVELAKKYGDEADYQFVNGLLGSLSRDRTAPPPADGNPEV